MVVNILIKNLFKLIQAIGIALKIDEKEYLKYLDIVCIGTISDIVPLVDENRVIVKLGLRLVEQTRNLGLRAILQASGYSKIDSSTISFGVAPRINACGRMGHQEEALKCLLRSNITSKYYVYTELKEIPLYEKENIDCNSYHCVVFCISICCKRSE